MREKAFIQQNQEKWAKFEEVLKQKEKDPDQLSELFVQVTDDLSYARTFYPNRSVRVYLNGLAREIFSKLYRRDRKGWKAVISFWKEDLPQVLYLHRWELLLSFVIFIIAAGIGALSQFQSPDFIRSYMGDGYVEMTLDNIEKGDPMGVYAGDEQWGMFFRIAQNNLQVSFFTFILGLFTSVGTFIIMLRNGIMIGCFEAFLYQQGVFAESGLAIWLHGTLEISAIVIAGQAGLVLGRGLLFPGTYSRLQAFILSGRHAMLILLGLTPIIIAAAAIESFLTRYTSTPDAVRLLVIICSAAFMIGYFVWYPLAKSRKGFNPLREQERLLPRQELRLQFDQVKNTNELFKESFLVYSRYFGRAFPVFLVVAAAYASLPLWLFPHLSVARYLEFGLQMVPQYFRYDPYPMLYIINTFVFSIPLVIFSFFVWRAQDKPADTARLWSRDFGWFLLRHGWQAVGIMALAHLFFYTGSGLMMILLIPAFPLLLLWLYAMVLDKKNPFTAIGRSFKMMGSDFGQVLVMYLIFLLLITIFFLVLESPFMFIYMWFIEMNITSGDLIHKILAALVTFSNIMAFLLALPLMYLVMELTYANLKEIAEGHGLRAQLVHFGERAIYGKK